MLDFLNQIKNHNNTVNEFNKAVRQGIPSAVLGVTNAFKAFLISSVEEKVFFIVKDAISAEKYSNHIRKLTDKKVIYIPPCDINLISVKAFSKETTYQRITAFGEIKEASVIILTPETLMQGVNVSVEKLEIEKNEQIDLSNLVSKLVALGYGRTETVQGKGCFSVRGDIVDVFPINCENPFRIDFFGDFVEGIKEYQIEDRKSLGFREKIEILQATEYIFDNDSLVNVKKIIDEEIRLAERQAVERLTVLRGDIITAIDNLDQDGLNTVGCLSSQFGDLFSYIDENALIVYDEAKNVKEGLELIEKDFNSRVESLQKTGEVFSFAKRFGFSLEKVLEKLSVHKQCAMQSLQTTVPFFQPLAVFNPQNSGIADYHLDLNEFYMDVSNWLYSGYTVLIFTGNRKRSENLCSELSGKGIASTLVNPKNFSGVIISDIDMPYGFIFHEEKLAVIGRANLYVKSSGEKRYSKSKKQSFFSAPEVGDYCVHETHGIGKVLGSKRISTLESTKDYVAVLYSGGDVLYVPVEQMDVLTRYLGGEKNPRLSKIGGADFERIKKMVKESIKKMSFDLKKLYSERRQAEGFKFVSDQELEQAFVNAFEFEDTLDQEQANEQIKKDMESPLVMDRLICGDVGFGKTEVAFRAIFRAIVCGKQAVLLAPTTILTEQHYNTALKRFNGFGVKIACLNRFRSARKQKQIIEQMKNGEIDLVIGTHRLLSKDVGFKDLGLLVLDEEQRFGVEHKEKIKLLKKNVDTLTLTATPIPRTLHMSLSGIRAISTINTPPKKRLPVQTYVTEETDVLIKDAITREINRGGQAFVLYNRVETIYQFAEKVRSLLPEIKLTVVHGQMDEKIMEENVMSFYNGETHVLISTTIIENGIDLPRANTLIVIDADRLGLSTLYQLKGRVGRSDRLAYAYFTFKRDKILSLSAYERLNAIIEFTEMGSGIKIAMRDLEIRGAGNILGAEQHGHMDKIGYELYSKLLREELSGKEEKIPELDVRITAYIPDSYIENPTARMTAYKEIAEIKSKKEEEQFREDVKENYGILPIEVENLITIATLKYLAMKIGVEKIIVNKEQASLIFNDVSLFSNEKLCKAIENTDDVYINASKSISIDFIRNKKDNMEMLYKMREFLEKY